MHPLSLQVAVEEVEEPKVEGQQVLIGLCDSVLTSNRVFSAIILLKPIPTPSMTASKHAQPIAEFLAAFIPPRTASAPPVKNPAMTIPSYSLAISHVSTLAERRQTRP